MGILTNTFDQKNSPPETDIIFTRTSDGLIVDITESDAEGMSRVFGCITFKFPSAQQLDTASQFLIIKSFAANMRQPHQSESKELKTVGQRYQDILDDNSYVTNTASRFLDHLKTALKTNALSEPAGATIKMYSYSLEDVNGQTAHMLAPRAGYKTPEQKSQCNIKRIQMGALQHDSYITIAHIDLDMGCASAARILDSLGKLNRIASRQIMTALPAYLHGATKDLTI